MNFKYEHKETHTHLLNQRCGALPRSLHVHSHLSDTVHVDVAKLRKQKNNTFTEKPRQTPQFHLCEHENNNEMLMF